MSFRFQVTRYLVPIEEMMNCSLADFLSSNLALVKTAFWILLLYKSSWETYSFLGTNFCLLRSLLVNPETNSPPPPPIFAKVGITIR